MQFKKLKNIFSLLLAASALTRANPVNANPPNSSDKSTASTDAVKLRKASTKSTVATATTKPKKASTKSTVSTDTTKQKKTSTETRAIVKTTKTSSAIVPVSENQIINKTISTEAFRSIITDTTFRSFTVKHGCLQIPAILQNSPLLLFCYSKVGTDYHAAFEFFIESNVEYVPIPFHKLNIADYTILLARPQKATSIYTGSSYSIPNKLLPDSFKATPPGKKLLTGQEISSKALTKSTTPLTDDSDEKSTDAKETSEYVIFASYPLQPIDIATQKEDQQKRNIDAIIEIYNTDWQKPLDDKTLLATITKLQNRFNTIDKTLKSYKDNVEKLQNIEKLVKITSHIKNPEKSVDIIKKAIDKFITNPNDKAKLEKMLEMRQLSEKRRAEKSAPKTVAK